MTPHDATWGGFVVMQGLLRLPLSRLLCKQVLEAVANLGSGQELPPTEARHFGRGWRSRGCGDECEGNDIIARRDGDQGVEKIPFLPCVGVAPSGIEMLKRGVERSERACPVMLHDQSPPFIWGANAACKEWFPVAAILYEIDQRP